jgi:hypothetical protein
VKRPTAPANHPDRCGNVLNGLCFNGLIDYINIYDVALSEQEFDELYQSQLSQVPIADAL